MDSIFAGVSKQDMSSIDNIQCNRRIDMMFNRLMIRTTLMEIIIISVKTRLFTNNRLLKR